MDEDEMKVINQIDESYIMKVKPTHQSECQGVMKRNEPWRTDISFGDVIVKWCF